MPHQDVVPHDGGGPPGRADVLPARPDRAYELHPQVGLRDERFGALAYHFGNRRLTFLNDRRLVETVRRAADHPDLAGALDAAEVPAERRPAYLLALGRLAGAEVIRERC